MTKSMVLKLQADAIDQEVRVASLLRTAKALATKLELDDALDWINRELDGYVDLPAEEIPRYRQLVGELKAYNPYHGWQAVLCENSEFGRWASLAVINNPIGAIEEEFRGRSGGSFTFQMHPEMKAQIIRALEPKTDVQLELGFGQLFSIVDAVRNLVLNWSLELEKAGILGEDMKFSKGEKKEAAPITQQYFAQNIVHIGDVSGSAQVSADQSATATVSLDLTAVADFAHSVIQGLGRIQ